jgi:hypothetical protein
MLSTVVDHPVDLILTIFIVSHPILMNSIVDPLTVKPVQIGSVMAVRACP